MQLSEMIEELIRLAKELNPGWERDDEMENDPDVLLAMQPTWPFEYTIGGIISFDSKEEALREIEEVLNDPELDAEDRERIKAEKARILEQENTLAIFIGEGRQLGYLREGVTTLLGWS